MPIHARNLVPSTTDRALGGSVIERSLRFEHSANSSLSRSFSSTGNQQTFTMSAWVKKCHPTNRMSIFSQAAAVGSNEDGFEFDGIEMRFYSYVGGNFRYQLLSDADFRDTNGWYHIVAYLDSTQATESDRAKIYVNGTQITDLREATYPSQNNTSGFFNNSGNGHRVGGLTGNAHRFDGYLADIYFLDGYAYDPSYFGYTESQTGLWRPKRYTGSYGSNGYHLNFSDNSSTSALGRDTSGNSNNLSLTNIATTDSMLDTPTNNFATWNAIDAEGKDNLSSFSEGNLKVQIAYQGDDEESGATLAFSSGKWYWEEYMESSTNNSAFVGVGVKSVEGIYANGGNHWRVRGGGGESDHNGSQTNVSGLSWTNGDIIGIAVDMDAGTWTVSKNGTFIGANIHTNLSGTVVPTMHNSNGSERHTFITNFGQDSSFAGTKTAQGNKDANGIGDFYYPVPSGYKALCSKNLPPNVSSIIRPQKHFETLLYTGNNASGRSITGLEFKPDLVWFKKRSGGGQNHTLFDSVRGAGKRLMPNDDAAEATISDELTSFNQGGFTIDTDNFQNENGKNYVAWCWKAGGAAVSNTDGTVTTTVSANPEAGFAILTYDGGGNNSTMGHGLGAVPACIIVKRRNSSGSGGARGWAFFHQSLPTDKPLRLNSNTAQLTEPQFFREDLMSTTVWGANGDYDTCYEGYAYIAYVWAEIPGYSKFGKYTGNGDADGTFVHLGFRPAWIMIKQTNDANNWHIADSSRKSTNPVNMVLRANLSNSESANNTSFDIDFLSNGFKQRATNDELNEDNSTYVYMAFAEQPGTTPFGTSPNPR